MRRTYLALSVMGVVAPYAILLPWIADHGLDVGLFAAQTSATPILAFVVVDVAISTLTVILLAAEGLRRGDMRMVWPILGTLTVGVSLSLPLYLYLTRASDCRAVTTRE